MDIGFGIDGLLRKSIRVALFLDDGTFSSIPGLPACSFQEVMDG